MSAKDVVDVLVEQNKDFKDMLQWSIGSIITLLVVFLTANFFTMKKMRQDEIEKIQAEVKSEIVSGIQERILPDINNKLNEQMDSLVKDKLGTLEETINKFNNKLDGAEKQQDITYKSIQRKFRRIEAEIKVLEGDFHITKNEPVAFSKFIDAADIYMEIDLPMYIKSLLDKLETLAEKLDYVGDELTEFITLCKKLEDIHQHQCDKIVKILNSKERLESLLGKYSS